MSLVEIPLSENALRVLHARYLLRNKEGEVIETPHDLFMRVSKVVADNNPFLEKEFYHLLSSLVFLPNSPTLMNAGTRMNQLSACFVLDIEDDLHDIMKTATNTALIFKSGGGVGINYSKIRPAGSIVESTMGVASGPVTFMKIIDTVSEVVKGGGKRRAASMGILEYTHKDIKDFIIAKKTPNVLENFNLSVLVDNNFMKDVVNDNNNDNTELFKLICESSWESAEPALLFLENGNIGNPFVRTRGYMRSTNPCGEQWLYPYESCNLGSIDVSKFVKDGHFDFENFTNVIRSSVRFLDNVLDVSRFPLDEIRTETLKTRRIGLGIMGLADLLYDLELPYNSSDGYVFAHRLMETFAYVSLSESVNLAKEKGVFPLYEESSWAEGEIPLRGITKSNSVFPLNCDWNDLRMRIQKWGVRNSFITCIAPTGSLSMIADCSSGIEPNFALIYTKEVMVGNFYYIHKALAKKYGSNEDLIKRIAQNGGSLRGIDDDLARIYITAKDLHYKEHLAMQALCQLFVQNAISKTINLPSYATVDDIKELYILAWQLKLKGVTVYRDGSRMRQVIHFNGNDDSNIRASDACEDLIRRIRNI